MPVFFNSVFRFWGFFCEFLSKPSKNHFVVALHRWVTAQGDMMSDESDKSDMSDKKHGYLSSDKNLLNTFVFSRVLYLAILKKYRFFMFHPHFSPQFYLYIYYV